MFGLLQSVEHQLYLYEPCETIPSTTGSKGELGASAAHGAAAIAPGLLACLKSEQKGVIPPPS